MTSSIRIVTINTWKGDGKYGDRLVILSKQLAELQPDIIACQECFRTVDSHHDTLSHLSRALNMGYLYTAARRKVRVLDGKTVDSESGLGILSKYPCYLVKHLELPVVPEDGDRKALIASVQISSSKKILITNVHLTHLKNSELRMSQIKSISGQTIEYSSFHDLSIICGDFNTTIQSSEIEILQNMTKAADSFSLFQGKPGEWEGNEFQVKRLIDHIFILPDPSGHYLPIKESGFVLHQPDKSSGLYGSDHPGILTEIFIN